MRERCGWNGICGFLPCWLDFSRSTGNSPRWTCLMMLTIWIPRLFFDDFEFEVVWRSKASKSWRGNRSSNHLGSLVQKLQLSSVQFSFKSKSNVRRGRQGVGRVLWAPMDIRFDDLRTLALYCAAGQQQLVLFDTFFFLICFLGWLFLGPIWTCLWSDWSRKVEDASSPPWFNLLEAARFFFFSIRLLPKNHLLFRR